MSIGNDDHCDEHPNASGDIHSDNVWVIFNHIYDVQAGINAHQSIHCGGSDGALPGECCCLGCCNATNCPPPTGCPDGPNACCGTTNCCSTQAPTYAPGKIYVIGNVFNHIQPFSHPSPATVGQAVGIGNQVQARVVNNTIYKCMQGVTIGQTHTSGECPPNGDLNNPHDQAQGITRNTSVTAVNNVMLEMVNEGGFFAEVRVGTGRYGNTAPYDTWPFTLTPTELGFGHSLHYGTNRAFRLPNGQTYTSVASLQQAQHGNYGGGSEGDDVPGDNPNLSNPGMLLFHLRAAFPASPTFMFNRGVNDAAYAAFQTAFPTFPHIYRDYVGNQYPSVDYCVIGAFGTIRD